MSDCLGGYCFYNKDFTDTIEEPRFVDRGKVTEETVANTEAQILEINSKTGLYPLYLSLIHIYPSSQQLKSSESNSFLSSCPMVQRTSSSMMSDLKYVGMLRE